jgi:5-hydroxyisourate hydrolase-like protein (transthyretin family)
METYSNADGRFELVGVEPGAHQLHASLPGYISQSKSYEVEVKDRGCAEVEIGMWTDASISGKVVSSKGAPATGVKVSLLQSQSDGSYWAGRQVRTDASGRFVLDKVEPGVYRVGVNHNRMLASQPYDARYFPAAERVEDAVDVKIEGSGRVELGALQLGEPQATRTVRTKVTWPNGEPVTNATVDCESNSAAGRSGQWEAVLAETNPDGIASCLALADYPLHGRVGTLFWEGMFGPPKSHEETVPVEVQPGMFDVEIDLKLRAEDDLREKMRAVTNEERRLRQQRFEERGRNRR